MLNQIELDFLRTFDNMDKIIERAMLIAKIESRALDSENADPDEITIIQGELQEYRKMIRELDPL